MGKILIKLITDHSFIEQYNRKRTPYNIYVADYLPIGIFTKTWRGSAIGGDIVLLKLTLLSFFYIYIFLIHKNNRQNIVFKKYFSFSEACVNNNITSKIITVI